MTFPPTVAEISINFRTWLEPDYCMPLMRFPLTVEALEETVGVNLLGPIRPNKCHTVKAVICYQIGLSTSKQKA